jgi:hypothetical protein
MIVTLSKIYLYVYLKRNKENEEFASEEVNIAIVRSPGSPNEVVKPEEGFTMEEVTIVRSLVCELAARRGNDLPNLSSNLLTISSQK